MADSDQLLLDVQSNTTPCEKDRLRPAPFGLVIFGASGDLTSRKLIPAVFELFEQGFLSDSFFILGCSRTVLDDETFRRRLKPDGQTGGRWKEFAGHLFYNKLSYDNTDDYRDLSRRIDQIGQHLCQPQVVLYHLAVPPDLHGKIAEGLAGAGLAVQGSNGPERRLVVEKPFGHDLDSARKLCLELGRHFSEQQIFRIDHYLAKETVQNLLVFRLANSIFEPLWNRQHIERVEILAYETEGVGSRAGYYDRAGVLRDMIQSHLMQLLALCAMEPPAGLEAERVRDEKVKVYRQLRSFTGDDAEAVVLGQYGPGQLGGRPAPGYRQEPGVAADSLTPTFAALRVYVDNWRWRGVPFKLVSGKSLAEKRTEICVHFRRPPLELFGSWPETNRLVFDIHPQQLIELAFLAKQPGPRLDSRRVVMRFDYGAGQPGAGLSDYARVLSDCLRGEQMLFWRQDGIELSWAYLEPLLRECENCRDRAGKLRFYPAGSVGPPVSFE